MRCFIAINLEENSKKEISQVIEDLKTLNADVKWVPAENLHVTLKFLGETPEDFIPKLHEKVLSVSSVQKSFFLKLSGAGVFPDSRKPRVVWIDIKEPGELTRLQANLEDELLTIGISKDNRPFSAHLTIGRLRTPRNVASLLRGIGTLKDKDFGIIEVRSLTLMKSELKSKGAEYTAIDDFRFR